MYVLSAVDSLSGFTSTNTPSFTITSPAQIVIESIQVTNETCPGLNNGTITINATGGTPPLQYSIDGGVNYQSSNTFTPTNPNVGTYLIIVKDENGCTTAPVATSILAAVPITAGIFPTAPTCVNGVNGKIAVVISGGVQPFSLYSYQ